MKEFVFSEENIKDWNVDEHLVKFVGAVTIFKYKEYYKIGLTYASNALEGNTLDLVETKVVLEDGITIGGKPLKDHYEAVGHAKAFDKIINQGWLHFDSIEKGLQNEN